MLPHADFTDIFSPIYSAAIGEIIAKVAGGPDGEAKMRELYRKTVQLEDFLAKGEPSVGDILIVLTLALGTIGPRYMKVVEAGTN